MFDNARYLTRGVNNDIPIEVQLFLWGCIDQLPPDRDYLQVFELSEIAGMQQIIHSSEQPEHRMVYAIDLTADPAEAFPDDPDTVDTEFTDYE